MRMIDAIDRSELRGTIQGWRDAHADVDDADGVDILDDVLLLIDAQSTLTPQNEALTVEQLREMDGEPVWVKCLKPSQYADPPVRWRILEKSITGNFGVWNGDCALIERTYGVDWLAYRRPPEGQEDT